MEAAIRFPGQPNRFLLVDVIDQSLTLNQIHDQDRNSVHYSTVARYGRLPNFGAFDYSKTNPSVVALGLASGSACLVHLREDDQPSETTAIFKLKQQRKCNSVALSNQNWLAVALDKTRSDVCLNIFDADAGPNKDPVRRLCLAEIVSSVRFFSAQPQELVVAAQRSCIRLYDLRDGHIASNTSQQVATRNVNNICIDPLDENYFASAGPTDEPAVTVWDKRWFKSNSTSNSTGVVFEFKPTVDGTARTTIWSLRYSGQQRGRLAMCSSRGELCVFDMQQGESSMFEPPAYPPTNPYGGVPWTSNHYVSATRTVEGPTEQTSDGTAQRAPLIAFDWIPVLSSATEQGVLALRADRKVDVLRVPSAIPYASITARNELAVALDGMSITETSLVTHEREPQLPFDAQQNAEDFGPLDYSGEVGYEDGEAKLVCTPGAPEVARLLSTSELQRERCRQGYLFDCGRNTKIVAGDKQLERLWEIVDRFRQQAAGGAMAAELLDLSFVGVTGICQERVGNMKRRTSQPSVAKMEDAIYALNISRDLPSFEGVRTEFPEHRILSLEICGWKFHLDTLEKECQGLIERGLYYQAVVQAVLHEYKHVALNILRQLIRSKTLPNIGLGALLASDTINEEQKEMCLWMAADTEDSALKALLTFLTTGDWRDVMKTNYLHLGYRVALALKYLNDTEIKGFLQTETARAIKNGDLEGLLLTGLGEQALDLLQTYMTRTNDLQTAVLATAYTNPLYVDDIRWEMWKETYFMQMQSWRAFTHRAHFVIQHTRMSRPRDGGRSLVPPPPAQVKLQCTHCQQPLARYDTRPTTHHPHHSRPTSSPAQSAGIVCPTCGVHMPRCAICHMWLGMPSSSSQRITSSEGRGAGKGKLDKEHSIAKFLTFCVRCQHGFHADHARAWFAKHESCPVPGCGCACFVR